MDENPKTWWDQLVEDGQITLKVCEWCHRDNIFVHDQGLCNVCEDCLKTTPFIELDDE